MSFIKTGIALISIVALVALGVWALLLFMQSSSEPSAPPASVEFTDELEAVLESDIARIRALVSDPVIVEAVARANAARATLTPSAIVARDKAWQAAADSSATELEVFTSETARALIAYQERYPRYSEIFVTDRFGLNVGQTNPTTDYYQADEAWWQDSYQGGAGRAFHGPIEFDESAQAEAISLYVPVIDERDEVIGIAKAVVNIAAIKTEL